MPLDPVRMELSELVDRTVPLTEFAWKFRYPGGVQEPSNEEVQQALRTAHELYNAILEMVTH